METCRTNHGSKWGQLPIMMRLHPGTRLIISWEPDCFPQVITVITSSWEPFSEPSDWDNVQPEHTCDWNYLTMHSFILSPSSFLYLSSCLYPKDGWRWAECLLCLFPRHVPSLFSAFTVTLYLMFRVGWPDLAYGISGFWALGPKLQF
jgi:hypothetical protein